MATLKCGNCGNVIPLPRCKKHNEEVGVGEINGVPNMICKIEGEKCAHQPLPACCNHPAYSRWI